MSWCLPVTIFFVGVIKASNCFLFCSLLVGIQECWQLTYDQRIGSGSLSSPFFQCVSVSGGVWIRWSQGIHDLNRRFPCDGQNVLCIYSSGQQVSRGRSQGSVNVYSHLKIITFKLVSVERLPFKLGWTKLINHWITWKCFCCLK